MAFISVTTKESRIMKKIYSFVFAAVALFSAASCQDELVNNETPTVQGEKFTITAIADAQTKTALTDEGFNSVWTPGDAIAVIDATTNGVKFTTDIQANSAEATFTSVTEFQTGGAPISMLPLVALYPYQEGLTCSFNIPAMGLNGDDIIKGITFPSAQQALKNGFDKTAAFTFANSTGAEKDALEFNNLYSLLKVTIAEEGITEVKVSATSGSLAGKVSLDRNTSKFAVVEGSSSVTLTGEFEKDGVYYICVLPGTYEGFSIALNGYTVKTKASAATFAAATVYDLGAVARTKSSWCLAGTHNGFSDVDQMYEEGDYYVLKNIQIKSEIKFKKQGTWDGAYAIASNPFKINEKNVPSQVGWNAEFPDKNNHTGANYDVYLKKDFSAFYVMIPGTKIENIGKTKEITVYCETSYTNLWAYTKYDVFSYNAYSEWPGNEAEAGTVTVNEKTYKKWTAKLPIDQLEYCHFMFNGGGNQTSDANAGPFVVNDEIYLQANGSELVEVK